MKMREKAVVFRDGLKWGFCKKGSRVEMAKNKIQFFKKEMKNIAFQPCLCQTIID